MCFFMFLRFDSTLFGYRFFNRLSRRKDVCHTNDRYLVCFFFSSLLSTLHRFLYCPISFDFIRYCYILTKLLVRLPNQVFFFLVAAKGTKLEFKYCLLDMAFQWVLVAILFYFRGFVSFPIFFPLPSRFEC